MGQKRRGEAELSQAVASLRWAPILGFSTVAVACVSLGLAVAALSPSPSLAIGALAAAVILPVITRGIADVSRQTFMGGAALFAIGGLYAVVLHNEPNITALELVLLVPAFVLVISRHELFLTPGAGRWPVRLYAFCSLGLLLLNLVNAVFPPAGLPATPPLNELVKNAEIFLIAAGVYCYVDDFERLSRVYGLLLTVLIVEVLEKVASIQGDLLAGNALMITAPLWVIALVLPFIRRPAVAGIGLLSFVVLVFARTRGAWIGLLVIAGMILLSRRYRWVLGRRGQLFMLAASVATVLLVLSVPALSGRVFDVLAGNDQSVHDRLAMDQVALAALMQHPLTGIGAGGFKPWVLNSPPIVTFQIGAELIPRDPHDVFAKFGAELGVPGLLFFTGWAVAVFAPAWRFWRSKRGAGDLRRYGVGLSFLALVLLLDLISSEWSALERVKLAIAAGALLSLIRFTSEPEPARFTEVNAPATVRTAAL